MNIKVDPDWWKKIFDEVYLLTDARSVCDAELTRQEVDLILKMLPIRPQHKILDLCGGHGRHSLELCARGFTRGTLLDYSKYLIDHARSNAEIKNYRIKFIQKDARETGLPSESFDHVLIMGNSLGYIAEPEADVLILEEAKRVLREKGWILIDVTDGSTVEETLTPTAWHEIDADKVVCRQRELVGNRVNARELVLSKSEGLVRDSTYSIRIYKPEELAMLMEKAGFKKVRVQTDFRAHLDQGDYGFMNCRMLAIGQKL
jgi:D-alanine-D-alanine ligase